MAKLVAVKYDGNSFLSFSSKKQFSNNATVRCEHAETSNRIGIDTVVERNIDFYVGSSFYRKESALSRDLGVLAAKVYKKENESLRVLDLLCGSGIRSKRYLEQAEADFVWANDGSPDTHSAILFNLSSAGPKALCATPEKLRKNLDGVQGNGNQNNAEDLRFSQESIEKLEFENWEFQSWKQWYRGKEGSTFSGAKWRITHEDGLDLLFMAKQVNPTV